MTVKQMSHRMSHRGRCWLANLELIFRDFGPAGLAGFFMGKFQLNYEDAKLIVSELDSIVNDLVRRGDYLPGDFSRAIYERLLPHL